MDRSWYATTYVTTAVAMLALSACNPFRSPFRQAPVVEVTGRTYPVEVRYRPVEDPEAPDRDQTDAIGDAVEELLRGLNPTNHALAVDIARVVEQIRGYGHVKARNLAAARPQWQRLMEQWRAQAEPKRQAA